MKRISELITTNEVLRWEPNDIITISAGTGRGKSYFIKNILYNLCKQNNNKRILMLIHRVNCKEQFIKEIVRDKKTDIIDIITYQKLEYLRNKGKTFDFSEYEYIVCDEFHYFLSDAAFNIMTDISLSIILSQNKIRIFMSATGDYMKRYIENIKKLKTIPYDLETDYSFIKQLTFFNKNETLDKFIEEAVTKKEKGRFFIQSGEKAYNLYNKYKDYCLFNCSKSNNKGYYKYVDQQKINKMLEDERFNELILITTSCLDTGVNIIDNDVKHIVVDMQDIGVLLQCIGRRRIQNEDDKIYIYIKNINNKQLGGMETQLKKKIEKAEFLRKHTVKEYLKKYPRARTNDYSNIVYDEIVNEDDKGTKKINELMYYKCKFDLSDIATMKAYGEYGYCKYIKDLFKYDRKYRIIEEDYKQDGLEQYLGSIIGKKLYKDEQKELIDVIGLKDARGRIQKSIKQFNAYFEANKIKFIIEHERKSIRVDGKIKKDSYWIIYAITLNVDENLDKAI